MMNVDVNDSQAILKAGYKILTEELGSTGFLKFMELVTVGEGDYTKEKYERPQLTLEDVKASIAKKRQKNS